MDLDGITHFEWLQAEKARVRAAASKNISPAALARLPKPIVPKREELPPVVLATKAHTTNLVHQEAARKASRKAAAVRAATRPALKIKRIKNWRIGLHNGRPDATADRALFDKIVNLAATASGLSTYAIHDFKRDRPVVTVRHICWLLLREFTGLSSVAIARVTNRGCHSSIINGIGRAIQATNTPHGAALYWELRTRLCAAGCVVVDDLEKGGRP
jgi:Bacterial dnaA protein helix-turn-helix